MHAPRLLVGFLAVSTLLAGCAGSGTGDVNATPSDNSTPTQSADASEPAKVVISLDGLAIESSAGVILQSSVFSDEPGTVALLAGLMGSTPTPQYNQMVGGNYYAWDGLSLGCQRVAALCFMKLSIPELGGLPVTTTQGIALGSTYAEVEALDPFVIPGGDGDGDGRPDLGIEQRTNTGPGQPTTSLILLRFTGDVVSAIWSPSSDARG